MNRATAMKKIKERLRNFRYIYKEERTQINEMHLTFKMDSNCYELQSSMVFEENWMDILTFISPRVVKHDYDELEYIDILKTINFINWVSKSSCGRMYLDDYGDIAISLRFTYDWLEKYPDTVISEFETSIQYYEDLFTIILDVANGKKDYYEAKTFITEMWNL